jgi:peptidoglycan hydrolase-like protein with peptidoglycan-binding domain
MFKEILEQISRSKKLMNLKESEKDSKIVVIGDDIIKMLKDERFEKIPSLSKDNMKIKDLIRGLSSMEERDDVDHVFLSIGKGDGFVKKEQIGMLSELLEDAFKNSKLYVIRPILNKDNYEDYESDSKETEKTIKDFYDEFKKFNVNVIGNYTVLDGDPRGQERKLKSLKDNIIDKLLIDYNKTDEKEDEDEVAKHVIIPGDDETDFDTIYEFINRFEKIVKSKNEYDKKTPSSFRTDIEQIQICLNFLNKGDIEINGIFDNDTEEEVVKYQKKKGLGDTGIIDFETLEDMLYDLKIKGFDQEDLSKFIKKTEEKNNIKFRSDDYSSSWGSSSMIDSGVTARSAGTRSDDDRIFKAILRSIGAEPTEENMLFFHAWRQGEGGKATYNPFNTTQPFNNASKYNSVGVRNFNSEPDGIAATVKTLKNGHYPCILDGLRRNIGSKNIAKNCHSNLKTWGTGGLIHKILNRDGTFTPPPIYRK